VVDNASEDSSAAAVRRLFPVVRLLPQESNLGFAAGHNRAFVVSRGRWVLALNPDSTVRPGALACLVAFADAHPEAAAVGPKVLNPDGTVQHSARKFPTLLAGMFRNSILDRLFPNNRYTRDYLQSDWDHSDPRQVDWLSGAALLIARPALWEMQGFDEGYFMYVEDMDFCWRAHKGGWQVWFCPDAQIVHTRARASDLVPNRMIYQHHKSMYRFYKKHYRPTASLLERTLAPLGLCVRASYFIAKNKWYKWLKGRR